MKDKNITTPPTALGQQRHSDSLTGQARAEESLREAHERLNATLNALPDLLFEVDGEGRVYDFRAPRPELLYLPPDEFLGKTLNQAFPKEPRDIIMKAIAEAVETGRHAGATYALETPAGLRWFELSIASKGDPTATDARFIALVRDVTGRKRAEEETQQQASQLEALRRMGLEITAQLDRDALMHSIASYAMELLGGTIGGLCLYRPEQDVLEAIAAVGTPSVPVGTIFRWGEGLAGRVWEVGVPIVVGNYEEWAGRAVAYKGPLIAAVVGVPIRWGLADTSEEFLGTLIVATDVPDAFSQNDAKLLNLIATQAAIAIRNVRQYEAERKRVAQLTVVSQVARQAASILDPEQLLHEIVTAIQQGFEYYNVTLFLLDETADMLEMQAITGGFAGIAPLNYYQRIDTGMIGWTARTGQPLLVNDVSQEPRYIPGFREGYSTNGAELCVPLKIAGRIIGVLDVQDRINAFDETDLTAMETLADQIAVAIENARLHQALGEYAQQLEQQVHTQTTEVQSQYSQLEAIFSSTSSGIVVTDNQGVVIRVNPVARAWLTRTLPIEDTNRLWEVLQNLALRVDERPEALLELEGLDLELKAAPISEPGAEEAAAVMMIYDISKLKALDRMKSNFVKNASHELRTPITTIQLYAHLMQRTPPGSEKWRQHLNVLVKEADAQAQLGESILQLSRIYAGEGGLECKQVFLDELVGDTVLEQRMLAREKGVSLVYRPFLPLAVGERGEMIKALVSIDAEQMSHVINDLVEDAIHYTPARGQVTVTIGQKNIKGQVWATVEVSNTGAGIPAEDIPHIFDRLFREGNKEPLSERVRKTGLRLMVAKQVVELHGGRVTVESKEGVGTTFVIWLPLTDQ